MTEVKWDGRPVGVVEADGRGAILHALSVPEDAAVGRHLIEACDQSRLCGQAVVFVDEPDGEGPLWALAALLVALAALAHYLRYRTKPSGAAPTACRFSADPRLWSPAPEVLGAHFPLELACGGSLNRVKVQVKDRHGTTLSPNEVHLVLQGGQVDVSASQSGGSQDVKLDGSRGTFHVSVHYDVQTEDLTVRGQWGGAPLAARHNMRDHKSQAQFSVPCGPVMLTITLATERPKVKVEGQLGPTTVTVVVEAGRMSVKIGGGQGPVELDVDCNPANPGVSLNADLGPAQLDCKYDVADRGDIGRMKVALTAEHGVLEQMDLGVTSSRVVELAGRPGDPGARSG
ncbi:MAG: hypothetical protein M3203_14195 [Actinomycetota bacterium]|nr:hypothetical protein [Actinomycetota bacterium]